MKYALLLAAEFITGLIMMGLVYSNIGLPAVIIIVGITAVLVVKQIAGLIKAEDETAKKKAKRKIALAAAIPAAVGILIGLYVVVSLFAYFG